MTPSYHDVTVYVGNVAYKPSENYALELTCTKASGWVLWYRWNGESHRVGEEFGYTPFCIEVAGFVICGKKPDKVEAPSPFGWDGTVVNPSDSPVTP